MPQTANHEMGQPGHATVEGPLDVLLEAWGAGRQTALDELMPLVVGDLRRLAAHLFARERHDHTLQPTALVHETYLHLRSRRHVQWDDAGQFFGYVAQVMRRLLVDHARRHATDKRGGGAERVPIDGLELGTPQRPADLVALDQALEELARLDERQSRIVELRFFAGLQEAEIAQVLGVSERTVRREWATARLWLTRAVVLER